jgi:hypothetical protein
MNRDAITDRCPLCGGESIAWDDCDWDGGDYMESRGYCEECEADITGWDLLVPTAVEASRDGEHKRVEAELPTAEIERLRETLRQVVQTADWEDVVEAHCECLEVARAALKGGQS